MVIQFTRYNFIRSFDNSLRPYSRQQAAFPMEGQQESKVWPAVARIDNAFGDRNLVCTCPSVEAVAVAA